MGRARDDLRPGYRSFPAGRHVILYRLHADHIEIVAIPHAHMNIRPEPER